MYLPDMQPVFQRAIKLASVLPGNHRDFSAQFPTPLSSTSFFNIKYSWGVKGPKKRVGSREFTHFSLHRSSFLTIDRKIVRAYTKATTFVIG